MIATFIILLIATSYLLWAYLDYQEITELNSVPDNSLVGFTFYVDINSYKKIHGQYPEKIEDLLDLYADPDYRSSLEFYPYLQKDRLNLITSDSGVTILYKLKGPTMLKDTYILKKDSLSFINYLTSKNLFLAHVYFYWEKY